MSRMSEVRRELIRLEATSAREASEAAHKRAIGQPWVRGADATDQLLLAIYFELRHQTAVIRERR